MEEPGSPPKGKWNIQDFSLDDLLDALNLPPDPTASQVTDAANSLIARMRAQGQIDESRFFEQAKAELLSAIEDDGGLEKEYNEQDDQETTMGNWWNHEYPTQGDQTQAEKATSRHQKVQFFPNSHFQMNRERLGVNQTYNIPVMQGTINPNQRNVTQRMVFIDSSQKQNLTLPGELTTDLTLDLSEPLTNVLKMRLLSITIPKIWYTFDSQLGNTTFTIASEDGTYPPRCVTIPNGNYNVSQLITRINASIGALPAPYNKIALSHEQAIGRPSGCIVITNTSVEVMVLTFFSPTGIDGECSSNQCASQYINSNLGWNLGLRAPQTTQLLSEPTMYGYDSCKGMTLTLMQQSAWESTVPVNTYGPQYFFLVVEDFNQNRLNKGVVSISDRSTKLPMPTYVEPGIVDAYTGDISCVSVTPVTCGSGPARAGRVVKTYPRRLTQAQIYTANEIMAARSTPDFRAPPVTTGSVLAVLPLAGASRIPATKYESDNPQMEVFVLKGDDLVANERAYFGPVDIERMRVKLIDDKGNPINLNGLDWSFTLQVEELYQY